MRAIVMTVLVLGHTAALAAPLASRPLSIRELTLAADTVVIGRIGSTRGETSADGSAIVTRVLVDVEQALKGSPGPALTIVQPGGESGGVVATVAGGPTFAPGERVLLFLSRRPDGALRVAHVHQGKFSIEPDPATGQPAAVRRVPGTSEVVDNVPLAEALALVRAALPSPRGEGR